MIITGGYFCSRAYTLQTGGARFQNRADQRSTSSSECVCTWSHYPRMQNLLMPSITSSLEHSLRAITPPCRRSPSHLVISLAQFLTRLVGQMTCERNILLVTRTKNTAGAPEHR